MGDLFDNRLNAGQQLLKLFADLGENPLTPAPLETISTVLKEI